MAFGSPNNQRMSQLSQLTSAGGTVGGIDLVADCAGAPGSPSDISLWDDFKASGTVSLSPSTLNAQDTVEYNIKIVPATVGTYWDTRIGANANNYNDGFTFSAEQTQGDDTTVESVTRPRGDTGRYDFEIGDDEEHIAPQITVTGQINDTAGAGGATYIVGDWLNGDSNAATCVVTVSEGLE